MRTDGQTDRHDGHNSLFSQFLNGSKKVVQLESNSSLIFGVEDLMQGVY